MEVLFWLAPAAVATLLAMGWATWTGRQARLDADKSRRSSARDDEAVRAKIGAALAKPIPPRARHVAAQSEDRGTGVAVRRSQSRPAP